MDKLVFKCWHQSAGWEGQWATASPGSLGLSGSGSKWSWALQTECKQHFSKQLRKSINWHQIIVLVKLVLLHYILGNGLVTHCVFDNVCLVSDSPFFPLSFHLFLFPSTVSSLLLSSFFLLHWRVQSGYWHGLWRITPKSTTSGVCVLARVSAVFKPQSHQRGGGRERRSKAAIVSKLEPTDSVLFS